MEDVFTKQKNIQLERTLPMTLDCGGHRAISCHHCWYNKTSDVKLDQDFYKYARTMCNGDCWFRTVGLNCRVPGVDEGEGAVAERRVSQDYSLRSQSQDDSDTGVHEWSFGSGCVREGECILRRYKWDNATTSRDIARGKCGNIFGNFSSLKSVCKDKS